MLSITTLFNSRILLILHSFKNSHKQHKKTLFNAEKMQRLIKTHPAIFYLIAYLGLPIGIMLAVFLAAYVTVAPLSFFMGWM